MMTLPSDPYMLLSLINMKLRDDYTSLDDLCRSMDIDQEQLQSKLSDAGFVYEPQLNQFR